MDKDPVLNNPDKLLAALTLACLRLCDMDPLAAIDLREHLYDTALEEMGELAKLAFEEKS